MSLVKIEGLCKSYGALEVLRDISLDIERGEVIALIGKSGSGKSTFLRCINNLESINEGWLAVDGELVGYRQEGDHLVELREREVASRRAQIGMVFQHFNLFAHKTAIKNVMEGPVAVRRMNRAKARQLAESLLEKVGLKDKADAYPSQLSGGQQQRVGLARALAMDTDILLMDEAFSALDPLIRSGMQEQLLELQSSLNKTILFITHDFDEALKIGNRIAVLKDGAVQQIGKPEEIVLNPGNAHIEEFVRDVNKARAIHVRTIMEAGAFEPCEMTVPADARCEDVLPYFAEHEWIGVADDEGRQIGRVRARQIIKALARYVPSNGQG